MNFIRATLAIFMKDLRIELRSREVVLSTAMFALLIVLLSHFAFGLNTLPGSDASAGVLWIAISFSGILALSRTFIRESEFNVWTAILMTPTSRAALYLGKVLGVLVFLMIVELILIPVIELFFHADLIAHLGSLIPILLLGTLGYAAVGTLFAAMTVRTRMRDLLLGVILYPLAAPILITAVKASSAIIAGDGLAAASDYLKLLIVIDIVFMVGGLWLFGPLMED
ncbi:MAG: ABC transporter permease [Proteobacteria bacterium]|nr:ABC transporter permease [Pseudomonadota bacterium]